MTTHKARFSLLTPNLMRLQYAPFDERPSMRVMTRPDAIAFSETIQEGDTVIHDAVTFDAATLRGDHITLRYQGDEPFNADNLTIEWRAGGSQGVWTPNTADLHNLGGTVFSMDNIGAGLLPEGVHPAGIDEDQIDAANLYNPWYFNQLVFKDLRARFGGEYSRRIFPAGQVVE